MLCCRSKPFHNDIKVYSILKCNLIPLIIIQGRVNIFNCYLLSLLPLKAGVSFCLIFIISVKSICCCLVVKSSLTLLQPHGPQTARLHSPWDSSGKNTGVGFHAFLQGIFPTQGPNPHLLRCRRILYHWAMGETQWSLYSPIICHKCLSEKLNHSQNQLRKVLRNRKILQSISL